MDDVVGLRQQVVRQRQVGQEDGGRRALGSRDTRIALYRVPQNYGRTEIASEGH